MRLRSDVQVGGARAGGDGQRVEEGVRFQRVADGAQAGGQRGGQAVHALGDTLQTLRAVVDGVHRRHHAQQHLRGTDVRGGLFTADMLLARLQREAVRRVALRIDRHADEAAGHRTLERIAHGHVAGVRAAETERHAKALRVADHHIGTPFARRGQQRERQQVSCGNHQTTGRVHGVGQRLVSCQIAQQCTVGARVLQQHAKGVVLGSIRSGAGHHLHADRFGARAHDFQRLRQHVVGHEEHGRLRLANALQQRHCLSRSSSFVQHRRVGDVHRRQVDHHLLEVQHRFQAALRDFRLVRRIGRVPSGVLQDVAQDHARRVRAVIALANQALDHAVLPGDAAQLGQRGFFRQRLREFAQRHYVLAADSGGDHGVDQRGAAGVAERVEHLGLLVGRRADVAVREGIARLQVSQGGAFGGQRRGSGVRSVHGKGSKFRQCSKKPMRGSGTSA